jgi:hypothetical protein
MLSMLIDGIFHNGAVIVQWDDGSTDNYLFTDNDESLMAMPAQSPGFVRKLARRDSVTINVMKWRDELVSDRVDLAGASRAIGALGCSP